MDANSAAKAVDLVADELVNDRALTTRSEITKAYQDAVPTARQTVKAVMARMAVTFTDGDPGLGDASSATEIARLAMLMSSDPHKFEAEISAIAGAANDTQIGAVATSDPVAAVAAAPAAAAPSQPAGLTAPAPVAAPLIAVQPAECLLPALPPMRLVDKTASTLFPDLPDNYRFMPIPTAQWDGPAPDLPTPDPHFRYRPSALALMSTSIRKRRPLLIIGDPGCGKTKFYEEFGASVGLPVVVITFDGSMTKNEIIGSFRLIQTPTGSVTTFALGLLPTWLQRPCVLVLDEIDQADPDIHYMLHNVYEGRDTFRLMADGGRELQRHKNCYVVGAANTNGRGSERQLTNERFLMSEATRDRFPYWLKFTYMKIDEETETLQKKTGIDETRAGQIAELAADLRIAFSHGQMEQPTSIRLLLDVAELAVDFTGLHSAEHALAWAMKNVLMNRASADDYVFISNKIQAKLNIDPEHLTD